MCFVLFLYIFILIIYFEENHKVPKKKTAMGFGETIYSKTKSAGYSRRETQCN
jgi:hypothetical protein